MLFLNFLFTEEKEHNFKKVLEFIFFIVYNVILAGKEISNYKDKV